MLAAAMISFVPHFGLLLLRVAFNPNVALHFALPSSPTSLLSAVASVSLHLELCRVVGLSPRPSLFLLELILRQLYFGFRIRAGVFLRGGYCSHVDFAGRSLKVLGIVVAVVLRSIAVAVAVVRCSVLS
jgi:hypothetical protein